MTYFIDLDDTLIFTTNLNNDAYNYALQKFNYSRIKTRKRITRDFLKNENQQIVKKIINEKQKYFNAEWIKYRIFLNKTLLNKIKYFGKGNCYLWSKADYRRIEKIWQVFDLKKYFKGYILDDKSSFDKSIYNLFKLTSNKEFVIYENNSKFFKGKNASVIEKISYKDFKVKGYLIKKSNLKFNI